MLVAFAALRRLRSWPVVASLVLVACSLDVAGTAGPDDGGSGMTTAGTGGGAAGSAAGAGGRAGTGGAAAGTGGAAAGAAGSAAGAGGRAGAGGAAGMGAAGAGGAAGMGAAGAGGAAGMGAGGTGGAAGMGMAGMGGRGGMGGAAGSTPVACGGLAGGKCAADEFCEQPVGQCATADGAGTCRKKGTGICQAISNPVCGCNGVTYSNDCVREAAGMSKRANGECPVVAVGAGDACGTPANGPEHRCRDGLVCERPTGMCMATGLSGTCVRASSCSNIGRVCGCNGVTYANECKRIAANVAQATDDPCLLGAGVWGGRGITLTVEDAEQGGSAVLPCGTVTIEGPLEVDVDGSVSWTGVYRRASGGLGSQRATLEGHVDGGALELTVSHGNDEADFELVQGMKGTAVACN